jgi:SAM-dependent methyltransferase
VPVVGGIARFAGETYAASFGRQWNRYEVARPEEDEAVFRTKTGREATALSQMSVLDAGCGGGRYARLLGAAGVRVVAVDLSSAVEKAAEICTEFPEVSILQADLLALPLADQTFDFAYSIGVLHHTPNPRQAFARVAAKVKPGGQLAVWLYRKNTAPQEWINTALRAVTTRLPARCVEWLAVALGVFGGVPILSKTINKVIGFSTHPDWTLRVCDNFDWYAPKYQSHHTVEELKTWFCEEGFIEVEELPPQKSGRLYRWAFDRNLLVGSGVNVLGKKATL